MMRKSNFAELFSGYDLYKAKQMAKIKLVVINETEVESGLDGSSVSSSKVKNA